MSLFALLAALLWEHYRPRPHPSPLAALLDRQADWLLERFNAGQEVHGWLAWGAGVLAPALLLALLGHALADLSGLLAWAWAVPVLYLAMGYKTPAENALAVAGALLVGDLPRARRELAGFRAGETADLDESAVIRLTVEYLLGRALSHLFGVIFWFCLLGVFGAGLYYLGHRLLERWRRETPFVLPLARLADWLDWLPARALALSFAVVGDFDGAWNGWRGNRWPRTNEGVVLASGAGALGIRLGGPLHAGYSDPERPELGQGEWPDQEYIQGAAHLVLRALLLWLGVLLLLGVVVG